MDIKVYTPEEQGDTFYAAMGPFFASRAVRRELPYICNSPTTTWVLTYEEEKVVAFAAFEVKKNEVTLNHAYVLPDHRGKGYYSGLIAKRLELLKGHTVPFKVALRHKECVSKYEKYGFKTYKSTKNYTFMQHEPQI